MRTRFLFLSFSLTLTCSLRDDGDGTDFPRTAARRRRPGRAPGGEGRAGFPAATHATSPRGSISGRAEPEPRVSRYKQSEIMKHCMAKRDNSVRKSTPLGRMSPAATCAFIIHPLYVYIVDIATFYSWLAGLPMPQLF